MINHWFIVGACLLLFPVGLLLRKSARLAGYERASWPKGWCLFVLMVDPVRAAVGAWAYLQGITPLVERIDYGMTGEAVLLGGVLAVGALIQTFSLTDEDYVFSPFTYCSGVIMFFCGPIVAVPALIFGIGSAVAMRVWTAYFLCAGLVCLILGPVTDLDTWAIPVGVGLACMLPPLAAVMAGRHMGFPRG